MNCLRCDFAIEPHRVAGRPKLCIACGPPRNPPQAPLRNVIEREYFGSGNVTEQLSCGHVLVTDPAAASTLNKRRCSSCLPLTKQFTLE
jgi:hypothetical protein